MTTEPLIFLAPARRSGVTVWRHIADTLAGEIRAHRFGDGGRLPSESELAARFQVNRHTLRQAVQALQDEGLVRVERGRGMFARHPLLPYPLGRRTRFTESLSRHGAAPERQLLAACHEPASERVAAGLCLAQGTQVLKMESLCMAEGQPLSLMAAWYPAARFPGLLDMLQEEAAPASCCAGSGSRTTCAPKRTWPRACPPTNRRASCGSRRPARCFAWKAWTRTWPTCR
jgi:GntR family phosphonate transport system transcriptional regulator